MNSRTPLVLKKMSQSNELSCPIVFLMESPSLSGTISMAGSQTTSAPSSRRGEVRVSDCPSERVTKIVFPESCCRENQLKRDENLATSPTMKTTGGRIGGSVLTRFAT